MNKGLEITGFLILLFALTIGALAEEARACSCMPPATEFVGPSRFNQVIAADAYLWVKTRMDDTAAPDVTRQGISVPMVAGPEIQPAATTFGDRLFAWAPADGWTAGASYSARLSSVEFSSQPAITFSVESAPGDAEPTAPTFVSVTYDEHGFGGPFAAESSCGEAFWMDLTVRGAPGEIVLVNADGAASADPTDGNGRVSTFVALDATGNGTFRVGSPICQSRTWNIERGDVGALQIGAMSLNGTFTGWGAKREEQMGFGCNGAQGPPSKSALAIAALILAALAWRRRSVRA